MSLRRRVGRRLAALLGWLTERLYHELAWVYDAVAWLVSLGRWAGWRRLALRHLGRGPVLELGFGTGELLLEMRRRGILAVGIDRSRAMHRVTARKARRRGVAIPVALADARALPFAAGTFGTIVSTFPAAYILAPETMAEAARLLAPGGRLVVAGLYVESDAPLLRLLAALVNGGDASPALDRLRAAAVAAGLAMRLEVEEGRGFRLPIFVLTRGVEGCDGA